MIYSSNTEAQEYCTRYQALLRLTEWSITCKIVRQAQFKDSVPLLGQCEVLDTKQIAVIRLLDPIDFTPDHGFISEQDHELTLLHELLHVRLADMRNDSAAVRELAEERAVHALSRTLKDLIHAC